MKYQSRKRWTLEDDKQLWELYQQGKSELTIARNLGRTVASIGSRKTTLKDRGFTLTPQTKWDPSPQELEQPLSAILIQGDSVAIKGAKLTNQQILKAFNLLLETSAS